MGASDNWDAIIVGGGPAGAATAITAAGFGCRVLVLEAQRFPRHHVGESLVNLWATFETLGVAEEMDATFQHKRGAVRVWGREPTPHVSSFDYLAGSRPYSLQVERSLFDQILLRRAESVGATVCQGYRVTDVIWRGDRAVGVRYTNRAGSACEVRAPFVIDASGRAALIARRRNLRLVDPFYPDLSVYGYFTGARRFQGDAQGHLLIEAVPWGWFWFIPLHTGEVSVGLVCDRSSRPDLRLLGPDAFLHEAIAQSRVVSEMLAGATLARPATATASYGYSSARWAGPGWLLAGDAGSFADPMWATGVATALFDGMLAGAVIEAVQSGRIEETEATAHYDQVTRTRFRDNDALVKFIYGCNRLHAGQPFWRNRFHYLDSDPPDALLRRVAQDGFAIYFREVLAGMGLDQSLLSGLDRARIRTHENTAASYRLLQDTSRWIPVMPPFVRLNDGLGQHRGRLVRGLQVDFDGTPLFIGSRPGAMALRLVNNSMSVRAIIDTVLQATPAEARLPVEMQLLHAFQRFHQGGLIEEATQEVSVTRAE